MNQLLELSPLIVFFVVFKLQGIYWATGSLMAVCTAVMLVHRFRAGSFKPMHVITVAVLLVLGSATLEGVFDEPLEVAPRAWQVINFLWVGWFALLAAANLYVARNFDDDVWVKFKVFGITAAMVVFMIPQVLWLSSKLRRVESETAPP
jgi:intracellular septation protein